MSKIGEHMALEDYEILIDLIADIRELIIDDADDAIQYSMVSKPECVLMFAKEWIEEAKKDIDLLDNLESQRLD